MLQDHEVPGDKGCRKKKQMDSEKNGSLLKDVANAVTTVLGKTEQED